MRRFERPATILALSLAATLAMSTAPRAAHAQRVRDLLEAEGRAELDTEVQLELEAVEEQRELAGYLYVSSGVLLGVGIAAIVVGSIGTLMCTGECTPWHVVLGAGGGTAAIGLGLFIPAAVLDEGATNRRRQLLREHLAVVPMPGGAMLALSAVF